VKPAPRLVLVEPQDLVNIAATVRIARNFGIDEITLVNPQEFDPYRIEGIAHNTAELVERITFAGSLDEALRDVTFAAALSARGRTARRRMARAREAAAEVVERQADGPVALVFGREDAGLTNEELDHCQLIVNISTNPDHRSLNLAQAVAIMAYEVWNARGGDALPFERPRRRAQPASGEQLETLFADWHVALDGLDFFKARNDQTVMRSFREMFFRADLDAREAALLRAVGLEVAHVLGRQTAAARGRAESE
jgi:TrmH family RNA methyltransferase